MTPTKYPYITVSRGIGGYYSVMIWWNPEGFEEPYQTGIGRFKTSDMAIVDGKFWARAEGIPFRYAGEVYNPPKEAA